MRISDWSSDVCSSDLAVPSTTASTSLIDVFLLMVASSFRTIGVALRNITKGRPDAGQTANRARIVPGIDNLPVLRGGERQRRPTPLREGTQGQFWRRRGGKRS